MAKGELYRVLEAEVCDAAAHFRLEDFLESLLHYLVMGYLERRDSRLLGRYEVFSCPSLQGPKVARFEYLARLAPFIAAWLKGGGALEITLPDDRKINLSDLIAQEVESYIAPRGRHFCGLPGDYDQRVCEAADVALSLWLMSEAGYPLQLSEPARVWMEKASRCSVIDNNWLLFPSLINSVGKRLQSWEAAGGSDESLKKFLGYYRGEGWFQDGPEGEFDYYNLWAAHYGLFWKQQIDGELLGFDLAGSLSSLTSQVALLFNREGVFPAFGRSSIYRLALPTCFSLDAIISQKAEDRAFAIFATFRTWEAFVRRGALRRGVLSKGFYDEDLSLLENYSGPYSALWSLRSVIPILAFREVFRSQSPEGLSFPVGSRSYDVELPVPGWRVVGRQETGEVCLYPGQGRKAERRQLESYSWLNHLRSVISQSPRRAMNRAAKYKGAVYSTDQQFFE